MKKNFKKALAVLMATMMLLSVVSVFAAAASYTITFGPGNYGNEKDITFTMTEEKGTVITLPGVTYTREGYDQIGWTSSKSSSGSTTSSTYLGDVGASYTVTKKVNAYPYWKIKSFDVVFAPGADGVGEGKTVSVNYNKTTKFPGNIFTREGYVQIGWSTVDGGEVEFGLTATTPKIVDDTTYYPVWEICDYSFDASISSVFFGNVCMGYAPIATENLVITNEGNMVLNYTLPTSSAYEVKVVKGDLSLSAGESVTVAINPVDGLAEGDYAENLFFDCDTDVSDFYVAVSFAVKSHNFIRYESNNDATYSANGTKTAYCTRDCGASDTIVDEDTMKLYGAEHNAAVGLSKEYIYHRTVRFTAYGSGSDDFEGVIGKRFVPVSWYVNDEYNGEFEDGNYLVEYTHTKYGEYTLTIQYIEEAYDEETGEWVATGVTSESVYEYEVAPNEKEQDDVQSDNILSIFTKIFQTILSFFTGLFG